MTASTAPAPAKVSASQAMAARASQSGMAAGDAELTGAMSGVGGGVGVDEVVVVIIYFVCSRPVLFVLIVASPLFSSLRAYGKACVCACSVSGKISTSAFCGCVADGLFLWF